MKGLSLIVAMGENRAIGFEGRLPWNLPREMALFVNATRGKALIMGRKTYEANGGPLPKRRNLVVTRQKDYSAPGGELCASLEEALEKTRDETEPFLIGGENLYREALTKNYADKIYLSIIQQNFEGDTFFPIFNLAEWKILSETFYPIAPDNSIPFIHKILVKV